MKFAIAMTTYNRPDYLHEVLDTWKVALGEAPIPFLFSCEPDQPAVRHEVDAFVEEYNYAVSMIVVNESSAIDRAFNLFDADFVILAEDDVVVYEDILPYFRFVAETFESREDVLAACAFSPHACQPDEHHAVRSAKGFSSLVWGIWKDKWPILRDSWDFDYSFDGWDWHIRREILPQNNMTCVFPILSRSQHIGRLGGSHCLPEQFDALKAPSYAGNVQPTRGRFHVA